MNFDLIVVVIAGNSFLPRRVRGKNTTAQPPWAAFTSARCQLVRGIYKGDVIPLVASVSPEWISAYDTYPITSYNEKLRILAEASRKGQALIYCHDAYIRCTTVKRVNTYYKKDKEIPLKKTFLFP